eukprot:7355694-Ditylum_brightwellii.AAC.1
MAVMLMKRVEQTYFIGVHPQAKATEMFSIRLPEIFKQYFPYLFKYFGPPVRLQKTIYGLTQSGELWVTEFAE